MNFKGRASEGAYVMPLLSCPLLIQNDTEIKKDCHNEVNISSLQGVLKRPPKYGVIKRPPKG